ncbi:MAG: NAD(P)-dependent oxidoreductase [Sedimenticola sp.]
MARFKVLISAPYLIPFIDRFRPMLEARDCELVVVEVEERLEEEDLLGIIGDIDGVVCGDDRFTAKVIEKGRNLRVLSKWGTGIDSIDQHAAAAHGVEIRNIPNAFSEPVGDTVLGWMLCFARRIIEQTELMRDGAWEKLPGHALNESTLGIIGLGNCGKAVARRAQAFGMTVLASDIVQPDADFIRQYNVQMISTEELLKQADYVRINCALNPTSDRIMNESTIGLMKVGAVLINAARGPLIKEAALVAALREGHLRGAALDVFEDEPLAIDSPLRSMPNVFMASHNANSSPAAWDRVHERALNNMLDVLESR